jgi:hypothetical protein
MNMMVLSILPNVIELGDSMRDIQIGNVRLGLATNSSSVHSLIFLKGIRDSGVSKRQFGWDHFTAASKTAKIDYLAAMIYSAFIGLTKRNDRISSLLTNQLLKTNLNYNGGDNSDYTYVDHQSEYQFPYNWEANDINMEFFEDFKNFLLQDGLVILGGNDNGGEKHPLDDGTSFKIKVPQEPRYIDKPLVARKDGEWWVLFNRANGAKVRMSFNLNAAPYEKASLPELVDISITNKCEFNCEWCFQDASVNGLDASSDKIYGIIDALRRLQVFEVAIGGGGEPTMHPYFIGIISNFRRNGIIPNFSTRSLHWLRDNSMWPKIIEVCGAFAFSIKNALEIEKLNAILVNNELRNNICDIDKVSLQYVMGTQEIYCFEEILKIAHKYGFRITLLGYKETGRGSSYIPKDYSTWLDICLKLKDDNKLPVISIDTALAEAYEEQIVKAGIPNWMFSVKEGAFSMYIDVVNQKMGPSSFCASNEYIDFPMSHREYVTDEEIETIKQNFAKF